MSSLHSTNASGIKKESDSTTHFEVLCCSDSLISMLEWVRTSISSLIGSLSSDFLFSVIQFVSFSVALWLRRFGIPTVTDSLGVETGSSA